MVNTIEKMTYTMKEFSHKVNLSPYTLRYYEKEGLLPSLKRLDNKHRVYREADANWIKLICCLRSTGMSIHNLRHYADLGMRGESTVLERKQIILNQKQKIEDQLEELKTHLEIINRKIDLYDEIISKQVPPQKG
jgi:MerR family transcriptional regulator, aldehyde-responsive regulator